MKTSKKLVVAILVLVLATASFIPATFSWYDHAGTHSGNKMSYTRSKLPVSAGAVSAVTKKYRTDNNKLYYDEKGNKEYVDEEAVSRGSVDAGATQFYGTTFTNTGTAPAYVNLYLKNFTHNSGNYIGTLQPSLTHKKISSSVHLANKNMIRVYFQWDMANNWNTQGAKTYVVYTTKSGAKDSVEITKQITKGTEGSALLAKQTEILGSKIDKTYYVDLADDTTEFYFATDGKSSGFDPSTLTSTQPWYRTRTITNVQPEMGYYLTGVADDTTWNAQYASFAVPGGVSVMTYFDTAVMSTDQHAYVTLNNGTNYTGASAAYQRTGGSTNLTVSANTGYITTTSSFGTNSNATITTTIKGSLGDETTVETLVSNPPSIGAATVSLNIEIPGAKTETVDGQSVTTNGTAEVVWYITNSSTEICEFDSIYYTK